MTDKYRFLPAAAAPLILNVDDNLVQRYSVTRILQSAGYAVIEASTGREALDAIAANPDLVMLDVSLPDMSGFDVCNTIKSNAETSSIPVLELSAAYTEASHRALGLNLGADGYLTHPVETSVLLATVRSLIRMHEAESEALANAAALQQAYREQKHIAETLQRSLLISVPEDNYPSMQIASFYEPAWEEASVGGDFYDTFRLPDDQLALVVGDATGKGLAAATRTAEVKFALRAFMHEHREPAVVLQRLNEFLCNSSTKPYDSDSLVAVVIGLVNIDGRCITIASAGAESPLLLDAAGNARSAQTHGLPLGAFSGIEYQSVTLPFDVGDTILMATDGITEARRGKEFLSYDGMVRLANDHIVRGESVSSEGKALLDAARAFANGKFQDDVCILLARRR